MKTILVDGSSLTIPTIGIWRPQENLMLSHAPGAGVPFPPEFVLAIDRHRLLHEDECNAPGPMRNNAVPAGVEQITVSTN